MENIFKENKIFKESNENLILCLKLENINLKKEIEKLNSANSSIIAKDNLYEIIKDSLLFVKNEHKVSFYPAIF